MSTIHIRGSLEPFLQWEDDSFDPQRGFIYRAQYKGLSYNQINALKSDYVRRSIACKIHSENSITTIEAEDSTQQWVLDTWEVIGNEEHIDGFSHPSVIAIFGPTDLANGNYALIRDDLENNTKPNVLITKLIAGGFSDPQAQAIARFYSLNQRGSPDYRRGQYVVRHSTNVSNVWAENISDFGIDQIYTPSELLTEVADSSLWTLPMPGRLQYKIANIPAQPPQLNYLWGWLKAASTETTTAYNRVTITQEYTLELWSVDYYQPKS